MTAGEVLISSQNTFKGIVHAKKEKVPSFTPYFGPNPYPVHFKYDS